MGQFRRQSIASFFVLLGLGLLSSYGPLMGAAKPLITKLAFGVGINAPVLALPTAPVLVGLGFCYLLIGLLGFSKQAQLRTLAPKLLWLAGGLLFPTILLAAAAGSQTNVLTIVAETLRLGTPIALGALAGLYAERAGVVNIAIEGMMLFGAAIGFIAFGLTANLGVGLGAALAAGAASAALHGLLSISYQTDQIVSGAVVNLLALGVTGYLRQVFLPFLRGRGLTLPEFDLPLLSQIPLLGEVLFRGKPIFYTMLLLMVGSHILLFFTSWGLRLRAVGENPQAAAAVGINVRQMRYHALLLSGMLAGLGGAWFSLETVGSFDDGMTAGKGFIALAAMIFGKWTPFGALGGALLFGFAEALGTRFQLLKVALWGYPLPVQFLQILPYLTTLLVLAGLIGRATPPAALGLPYEDEQS